LVAFQQGRIGQPTSVIALVAPIFASAKNFWAAVNGDYENGGAYRLLKPEAQILGY
jgi:hypothetical protein